MAKITLNNVTVSDAYLALLADRGIDYWFANAGTDFAPVVESLAKAQVLETRVPTAITCPHENTAMHMAIGYYLVTGKPQAVMVHVNVGTANGMNGLLNAARGHVPMLFTAGRTPTNEDGLDGHRSLDIHWTQEMFDQAGMLRESVKWDYELRNGQQLETVVDRALSIAKSEPMGPVYLSLPREVLAHKMSEFTYTTPSRQHAAAPASPNGDAVEEVAALLGRRGKSLDHHQLRRPGSQGMDRARRVRRTLRDPGDPVPQPLHVDSQQPSDEFGLRAKTVIAKRRRNPRHRYRRALVAGD